MSPRALFTFLTLLSVLGASFAHAEEGRDAGGGNCGRHNLACSPANLEEGAVRRGGQVQKGIDSDDSQVAGRGEPVPPGAVLPEID